MLVSPYLEKKGITLEELQNASHAQINAGRGRILLQNDDKVSAEHDGIFLYRELVDFRGQKVGVERILDQKVDKYGNGKFGDKFCTANSDTTGFTPFGFDPRDILDMSGHFVVCAGLAEGYRIHQATSWPVACGVGESNIPKIAQFISSVTRRGPDGLTVLTATDNDKAGYLAAYRGGLPYTIPRGQKDFSDVYQHGGGSDAVRWQIENYFPPLPIEQRESEILRLSGRTLDDYRPPKNTMVVHKERGFPIGYCVTLDIPKPHLIDGYQQLKTIANTMNDCVFEVEGRDQWLLTQADELTLAITLMEAGLMTSIESIPIDYTPMRDELLSVIREEGLDEVQVPGGIPALISFGKDRKGDCLIVDSHFDEQIAQVMKDAKGFFDRTKQEWRVGINTERQRDRVIDALCGNPLRRFMFKNPLNDDQWTVATPWTAPTFADCINEQLRIQAPAHPAVGSAPAYRNPGL